ncbi:MAG: amidase domain-containing protein [Lachnospiraceae bacterium]
MSKKKSRKHQRKEKIRKLNIKKEKLKKVLLSALISLGFIMIVPVICYGIVNLSQSEEPVFIEQVQSLGGKDAAIVPGISGSEGPITAKAEDRLQAAIRLYEAGLVRQIIVSGDENEVKPMAKYLMKKGIPAESLASDAYGVDTYNAIARVKEQFGDLSYYFCTQELYSSCAGYLMKRLGADGAVVCVDARYYDGAGKNVVRELFADTKAVFEPLVLLGKAKTSIEEEEFIEVEEAVENSHFVSAQEAETPKDCQVVDMNPEDGYDVLKAVDYARTYAFESNPAYGQFEQNCTNFVSQCLVAGGISMKGEPEISEKKRWNVSGKETEWYSGSEQCDKDGLTHYSMSESFIKTDAFFKYFTEERGYTFTKYDNNREGNLKCYQEMAAGDVLVLYNEDGTVAHLGLVSGIGEMNAYYCGNTAERRDYSVFLISEQTYSEIGILHMSRK